jgi:hypothetical protein
MGSLYGLGRRKSTKMAEQILIRDFFTHSTLFTLTRHYQLEKGHQF